MTKSAIRKKLYRRGYKLVTMKDAYGVPGYAVYDPSLSAFVFGGEQNLMTLEEIKAWIVSQ